MSQDGSPLEVYQARLRARSAEVERLSDRETRCANARLAVFAVGLLILGLSLIKPILPLSLVLLPIAGFIVLVVVHERTLRAKANAEGGVRFYERGIERIEDRWAGKGTSGEDLVPPDHLYAEDLDIFGEASLFALLCTARSRAGEEALARWLCAPAEIAEIEARQEAVAELRGRLDFREALALLAGTVRAELRPGLLSAWATSEPVLQGGLRYTVTLVLSGGTASSFMGWAFDLWSLAPFAVLVGVSLLFGGLMKKEVLKVCSELDQPVKDLGVFAQLAASFESARFDAPKLLRLQEQLTAGGVTASNRIEQLRRLVAWLDAQGNMIFAPVAIALLWPVHVAHAIERWRKTCGERVPGWLDAIGELEALCALAGYAYEHPEDPMPKLVETGPVYEGLELGHPLLPDASCVRNSIRLDDTLRLIVVSGSNMSGKSTLLRAVGINAVLALMGAPVRARSLTISPLTIGASLHVVDSIQRGTSHFYAEITRLRDVLDRTKDDVPVLYLVDEILHGTNSHDRKIGAEGLVKSFMAAGSIGLITTHDLALTETADALGAQAVNVHFVDHLEEDRLVFDYVKREGVVQRSNALALMRAIGLDV